MSDLELFFLKHSISVGVDLFPTSKQIHKPNKSSVGVTKKLYLGLEVGEMPSYPVWEKSHFGTVSKLGLFENDIESYYEFESNLHENSN